MKFRGFCHEEKSDWLSKLVDALLFSPFPFGLFYKRSAFGFYWKTMVEHKIKAFSLGAKFPKN